VDIFFVTIAFLCASVEIIMCVLLFILYDSVYTGITSICTDVLLWQSEIGFGKLESYTKLDKLGEVSHISHAV